MTPTSLSFSSTQNSTSLLFKFASVPSYYGLPQVFRSDGTELVDWTLSDSGNDLTLTTQQSIPFDDYLIVVSNGSWSYPSLGQYFVGGKGGNTIDLNVSADVNYQNTYVVFGNDGNDVLSGTSHYFDTLYAGEGSDTVIDGGGGAWIDLLESVKKQTDTVILTPALAGAVRSDVSIVGFDTSYAKSSNSTNDRLLLPSGTIAASGKKDGIDVGLITHHVIDKGVVTFTNVPITTDGLYQDALDYLYVNLKVGDSIMFNAITTNFQGMVLYQKGNSYEEGSIVKFESLSGLTLGNKIGAGIVTLADSAAPILQTATVGSNGITLQFNEAIASMKSAKTSTVTLNGTESIAKFGFAKKDNTITITSKTLAVGVNDFVQLTLNDSQLYTVTDKAKNKTVWSESNIIAVGTDGDTTINLSGQNGSCSLYGNGGDDLLTGSSQDDTLSGGIGNDTLSGGTGNDLLVGDKGNDRLDGGIGMDTMVGGLGDDVYVIDNENDVIYEWENGGSDTVECSLSVYHLHDTIETLAIKYAGGASVEGNGLDNIIVSGTGNDVIRGLDGNDTVSYSNATTGIEADLSLGTALSTSVGNDILIGIENIRGSNFMDILTGDAQNNILWGGMEDDNLSGGEGDDTIDGGSDNAAGDTIDGGDGNDTVSYASATQGVHVDLSNTELQNTWGGGSDTITNIENIVGSKYGDKLQGDGIIVNTLSGGLGNDQFYINSSTVVDTITDFVAGKDTIVLDSTIFIAVDYNHVSYSAGVLYYDSDGVGADFTPVAFLALSGVTAFDTSSLMLGVWL